MNLVNQTDSDILAFLDFMTFDDEQAFRGGCLVTDLQTYPREFRLTSPIQPTPLQATLFGKTLKSYICVELVALPLLKAIKANPVAVLVRSPLFLLARPRVEFPILLVNDKTQLQTHKDFMEDGRLLQSRLPNFKLEFVLEPFMRIQAALAEAHKNQIGV